MQLQRRGVGEMQRKVKMSRVLGSEFTTMVFIVLTMGGVLYFHWEDAKKLSEVQEECNIIHEKMVNTIGDFKKSVMDTDLMQTFFDVPDIEQLKKDKKKDQDKIAKLIRQMKTMQKKLVSNCKY